jgi:hypothetical protein
MAVDHFHVFSRKHLREPEAAEFKQKQNSQNKRQQSIQNKAIHTIPLFYRFLIHKSVDINNNTTNKYKYPTLSDAELDAQNGSPIGVPAETQKFETNQQK